MTRIWMNHWFSTAYNIVNLIKQDDPEFLVIGSNENILVLQYERCAMNGIRNLR